MLFVFLHFHHSSFFNDDLIQYHMHYLRNELMEQNFIKIVEPYDVVELSFIASKMQIPLQEVGRCGEKNGSSPIGMGIFFNNSVVR